ncbi:hypothetical protein Pint_34465 [Pistacia integerrima]|uniref:Uncharacterized protein n=1 Tax=Pistacia integerrima TaxID=434235 RepID=A0ACC0X2F4_9ROSI|nr:hypothetical protein Pint_34465 [Pistacia integerrima]
MAFTVAQGLLLLVATASMSTVLLAWLTGGGPMALTSFSGRPCPRMTPTIPLTIMHLTLSPWVDPITGTSASTTVSGRSRILLSTLMPLQYDPPSSNVFPHSVYLLPNLWSYLTCDLSRAKMIANSTQGGGDRFKFVLKRWQPYYFACGERGGLHCRYGNMKFMVMPLLRRWHY